MPLMKLNLQALPDGLESHKQFLKEEIESWLAGSGRLEEADVTFICSAVDSDNCEPVRLAGHQAVLAPVSEVLRQMFVLASCSHSRQMVHITVDCDPKVRPPPDWIAQNFCHSGSSSNSPSYLQWENLLINKRCGEDEDNCQNVGAEVPRRI